MQITTEHLSPEAAQAFIQMLPDKIRLGLLTYAAQIEQPIESIVEMAIAGFLDEDSISFSGCNPLAVVKNLK
ncbi:hypothetical protein JOY44_27030 (plasmid) [Phormidium sp. CLA17]|uniref:hypothetical protein n=2 Tax=Leptolyngbya sp. Cla-17 TaxID=2803751 RepID=UPI001491D945|nr:hypothetical protein [Leptolyngbya sp. Cla-17]MBM0744741.1 hypothetical protein [Leptolyngbya sp. Cla-17]MBM0744754.1 hypothetical protein [Leptolyngbya sp. Cla-17]MBM0745131.1 hypothetical protein [Leptolyngbya sp. Cla-17]MBM0745143.1 hypothetical protein [Leptolyngbya sp. Cla-17]